jgi:hypothetical protein
MSAILFPHITKGLAFDVKPKQIGGTTKQSAWALGKETRISRGPDLLNGWTLHYRKLEDGLTYDSLNQLKAFFHDRAADYDSFLLKLDDVSKATHSTVTGQPLTVTSGYAPFVINIGTTTSLETIFELAGVNGNPGTPPVLHMAGTGVLTPGTDYTIQGPGVAISGTTYPGLVAIITHGITGAVTADFTWYYRVRFEQNEQEYEMFHYLLYEAQEVRLIEVRDS